MSQFQDAAQAALGFVVSQTSFIRRAVNEKPRPSIQYPGLIPVPSDIDPFAKSVTYYAGDKVGVAGWISHNANDMPLADVDTEKFEQMIYEAGIGYSYGWLEVQQAMRLGVALTQRKAMAARRAAEEMLDRIAFSGDTTKGFLGIMGYTGVTATNAATGTWSTATDAQIIADFNQGITKVSTESNQVFLADTVLLPHAELQRIAAKPMSGTSVSVLTYLKQNNVYTNTTGRPLTIMGVRGLETAGAGSTKRIISYFRDPEVLEFYVPMMHRFLEPQMMGLNYLVPGLFTCGGLDVKYPDAIQYTDGI